MASLWGFPNPVNEKAARVVAGGVVLLSLLTLITGRHWLIVPLALGFGARVATGPKLSLLGRLATQLIAPRLGLPKFVPGPPKRFAQAIGLVLTTAAAVLSLGFGLTAVGTALIVVLLIFATLEAVVGFCAGCWLFGLLMRAGIIPADTCEACNNVWTRYGTGSAITPGA